MGRGQIPEIQDKLKDNDVQDLGKKRQKTLPEKQFHSRPSLLTQMLEKKELQTVHNLFLALMVHCIVCAILSDLLEHGSLDLGYSNMNKAFGKIGTTFQIVLGLHLTPILALYPVFHLWTRCIRTRLANNFVIAKVINLVCYATIGTIIGVALYIPCKIQLGSDQLPWASSVIVVMEQLRITMKMYAFSRTNIARALKNRRAAPTKPQGGSRPAHDSSGTPLDEKSKIYRHDNSTELRRRAAEKHENAITAEREVGRGETGSDFKSFDDDILCPSFGKFLYFLYAPTLIYRDNYPRSTGRNWNFILSHLVHILACMIFYNLMHQRFGYVMLQHIGPKNPISALELVNVLYYQFVLGMSACVIGWLVLLHSSQNIFAELLQFGDRNFYKDWWNCKSMSEYHRTWNTPVQDFLYAYVYKEAWECGLGKRLKWLPTVLVFFVSNVFHEYAVCFVAGFFCPVMGIMFMGPGTFLTFIPNRKFHKLGNIFMLWSICLGHAFMHVIYVMEYFSRANGCPPAETPLKDFFVPRMLNCGVVSWS